MSELKPGGEGRGLPRIEEEGAGLDYATVLWRYRWLIGALCVLGVATMFVLTIRTPRTYESAASLLVKEMGGTGGAGAFPPAGLLQQVPLLGLPSLTPNRDMVLSVLKSRRLAQAVVERFELKERYGVSLEGAIDVLQGVTSLSISREGVVSVKVEDTDRELAAHMANFYAEEVDRLVSQFSTSEAGRQRAFIADQLAKAKGSLETAEETVRRFQERNRAIVLQEQTRGAIDAAARLKGEVMAAEVQLQVMRNFATEANPDMVAVRRRIEEMKRQLAQMQYGDDGAPQPRGRDRRDIYVPVARVPEIGLELARLTRDVKVQETLVTLLTQQFEQLRLTEARDLPIVQVLDRAVPAERHSKPRFRTNLARGGATGLLLGILLAFPIEYLRKVPRRPRAA